MKIKDRILSVSKKLGLTHIGSCLTAANAIEAVYEIKEKNEKFVLSNGHAALALYLITHPNDDECLPIQENIHADSKWADCSTGSLGHGLGIAVGMAMAHRDRNVFCMVSDGEMAEGSILEALRIASDFKVSNLKVIVNCNGYSAYGETDPDKLMTILRSLGWAIYQTIDDKEDIKQGLLIKTKDIPICIFNQTKVNIPGLEGLKAHYEKLA